jgi:hypothetical protein
MRGEQDTTSALLGLTEWGLEGARAGRTWPILPVKQAPESLPQARAIDIFLDALARLSDAHALFAFPGICAAAGRGGAC